MSNQQASRGAAAEPPTQAHATSGGYSPQVLQRLVDKAAYFNAFSLPDAKDSSVAIRGQNSNGDCIGFRVNEDLHRLAVTVQAPTVDGGLKAANAVGESYGKFKHRWVLAPDDFVGAPGREPPATPLDPSRSQRFIMMDGVCTFGDGKDGFRGFGAGVTFPMITDGRTQLLAATVGTILEGFGSFKNHEEGTYVHCGSLSSEHGFTGNLLLRVMDSQGTLRTTGSLPVSRRQSFPEPDITYIVFRGQAVETDPVTPRVGPDGQFRGLKVVQGLRLISLNSALDDGPRSVARVGQTIGKITAHVDFNPTAPGGTALNPIPFTTFDELEFIDGAGRSIGGFSADSSEGRVFNIKVAGQAGIRFGGVGPILNGTGPFQGMKGLMTDNSVVIFQPHVSASLYVLRLHDPEGRFRSTVSS
ncbi:MAG: hypothetical protein H7Z16_03080 [Pyrinomonadaceae bacterium]|nr:hypothetical protein [Pyrinomonadaceae bacterium]